MKHIIWMCLCAALECARPDASVKNMVAKLRLLKSHPKYICVLMHSTQARDGSTETVWLEKMARCWIFASSSCSATSSIVWFFFVKLPSLHRELVLFQFFRQLFRWRCHEIRTTVTTDGSVARCRQCTILVAKGDIA